METCICVHFEGEAVVFFACMKKGRSFIWIKMLRSSLGRKHSNQVALGNFRVSRWQLPVKGRSWLNKHLPLELNRILHMCMCPDKERKKREVDVPLRYFFQHFGTFRWDTSKFARRRRNFGFPDPEALPLEISWKGRRRKCETWNQKTCMAFWDAAWMAHEMISRQKNETCLK